MENKKNISRKDFLKNSLLTAGMMPLHQLFRLNNTEMGKAMPAFVKANVHNQGSIDVTERIRGSWVRRGSAQPDDLILADQQQGCQIVLDTGAPTAILQAARFLANDIQNISGGYLPPIVNRPAKDLINIRMTVIGDELLPDALDTQKLKGRWEAYQIMTLNNTVWLVGSDFRGAAFAAYTLSERLGMDPLYIWSGYKPEKHTQLIMKKAHFYAPSPTFKYRGFFHDDEDLLPRPFNDKDYPLEIGDVPLTWYQRYFETALRLRMNMVAPYTRVHRRQEVQQCASDWGLFYTSHHYDILLSNPFGIERFNLAEKRNINPEWDWYKNKKGMIKYWRGGVEENKDLYTIWPVGLRGTDDHAYRFPAHTPETEQTAVFRQAIDAQIQTVKQLLSPDHPSLFTFTLYTEMLEKYEDNKNAFNLPEETIIVWPDDNDGTMRGLPSDTGKYKHGVYYHLAYYGGNKTKQSTHTISPERITSEFKKIIDARATEFMLVNVSELRTYVMEARLLAEICFNGPSILDKPHPGKHYIRWWSEEYFSDAAPEAAGIYASYYERLNDPTAVWQGSDMVQNILDKLHKKITGKKVSPPDTEQIKILKERHKKYEAIARRIDLASNKMNNAQRQFFFEQVKLGLLFDWRPTQAAILLAEAFSESDTQKTWTLIAQARKPLEMLEVEILRAERPPFNRWYRPTWIRKENARYNVHRPYSQIRAFIFTEGTISPIKPRVKLGHRIPQAKLWTRFLEGMEKIKKNILYQ